MSASSVRSRETLAPAAAQLFGNPLLIIVGIAFVVRLLFVPSLGFHNDVAAFEAWTLSLHDHPPWEFYAHTSFADYPPGYFVVLFVVAKLYGALQAVHVISASDPSYFGLRVLVKLPAIAMDLVDASLIYALVGRFASRRVALVAAAFFAFNPTAIYNSAYWGQIDSVSWGLILAGLVILVRASDIPEKTVARIGWAWLALAFSILMKPQGALIATLFVAYTFASTDRSVVARRVRGLGLGVAASLCLAYLVTALFHGTLNPVNDFTWLFARYQFGSNVYPYNTVNAFNLYAIKFPFWQPDTNPLVLFGVPTVSMAVWGVALVLAATALLVARYVQRRDDAALLEGAMLIAFAFFVFATRMHERYLYGAFLLAFPLLGLGRRYWYSAAILSVTLLLNLIYSFAYQTVMEAHTPGVDATNLWPVGSHLIAAVNAILFLSASYLYLGGSGANSLERDLTVFALRARAWFDPREGIATMTRLDWGLAALLSVASFAICIAFISWPAEKVFDEIYYARAGEEYLKHVDIFEFTHPPLTKLIITVSMLLFGGLHGQGDQGLGWRFLNVVIGALSVGVIYVFAKHLLRSTLFATIAASMLLFDGFHFVQSRIATPEITVAFFALCTLYAFYRLWIATQIETRPTVDSRRYWTVFGAVMLVGTLLAFGVAEIAITVGPATKGNDYIRYAWLAAFLWTVALTYLLARFAARRAAQQFAIEASYADGTRYHGGPIPSITLPDGQTLPLTAGKRDELASASDDDATRSYGRSGTLVYTTPEGDATYAPDGTMMTEGVTIKASSAWIWLVVLSICGGALAASKWNGLFDFFVVWGLAAAVFAQRALRRPALYGNPYGLSPTVLIAAMFVAAGAMYTLCYIPFFTLGHNFVDMVTLQHEMYQYHATLVATHPYASSWWQWPILERPISYFYNDFAPHKVSQIGSDCCVAEILALPNPIVWWAGLVTVPIIALLAWTERNKGYALLVTAYFLQWLPWIGSPRIAFEYHFYPNLAIIILANAIVLQRIWNMTSSGGVTFYNPFTKQQQTMTVPRLSVSAYVIAVVWAFVFFYPILAGVHVSYDEWHKRMWLRRWII